jgi:hypothetical protein
MPICTYLDRRHDAVGDWSRRRDQARFRHSLRQEPRRILARRNVDAQRMVRAFGLIIFAQPFAQTMRFHAHDRVSLLIEIRGTSQCVHRDVVFLDLFRRALEILGAHILEQLRQVRRAVKDAGSQDCFQFTSFLGKVADRMHMPSRSW